MSKEKLLHNKNEWGTPQEFFNELDKEFNFNYDPCANPIRKIKDIRFDDRSSDGLKTDWKGLRVYVNPPYSGNNIEKWIMKCYKEKDSAKVIVLLIPTTKTGTHYFHNYVLPYADIRFQRGRINFIPLAGQNYNSNPLYSMLCIFRKDDED